MSHTVGAISLMLPGAIILGWLGLMTSAFAGDNGFFADSSWKYAYFWGGVGGVSLGAFPGIAYGVYHRLRWVYPLFGAAACALATLGLEVANFGPQNINYLIKLYAGLLVFGFAAGGVWWYVARELANERVKIRDMLDADC